MLVWLLAPLAYRQLTSLPEVKYSFGRSVIKIRPVKCQSSPSGLQEQATPSWIGLLLRKRSHTLSLSQIMSPHNEEVKWYAMALTRLAYGVYKV